MGKLTVKRSGLLFGGRGVSVDNLRIRPEQSDWLSFNFEIVTINF